MTLPTPRCPAQTSNGEARDTPSSPQPKRRQLSHFRDYLRSVSKPFLLIPEAVEAFQRLQKATVKRLRHAERCRSRWSLREERVCFILTLSAAVLGPICWAFLLWSAPSLAGRSFFTVCRGNRRNQLGHGGFFSGGRGVARFARARPTSYRWHTTEHSAAQHNNAREARGASWAGMTGQFRSCPVRATTRPARQRTGLSCPVGHRHRARYGARGRRVVPGDRPPAGPSAVTFRSAPPCSPFQTKATPRVHRPPSPSAILRPPSSVRRHTRGPAETKKAKANVDDSF